MQLPKFVIEIYSLDPDGERAAILAASAAKKEFEAECSPGFGSFVRLSYVPAGAKVIAEGIES